MKTEVSRSLSASGVRFVRVVWCDNANIIRAKAVHIGALDQYHSYGVGISAAQQALPVMFDAPAPESGLGPVGEVWLVPDWSTLSQLPYNPHQARVVADMVKDGRPWALCPRSFLKRMVLEAAHEGVELRTAFENEFYLLRPGKDGSGLEPVDTTVFGSTLAMDLNSAVISEIAEALVTQGLSVEQYYPESGPGQQEISVRYSDPLSAADHQIVFRETVHAVALRHGLKASFLPKIFADKAGSGCHVHMSLWHNEKNLVPDPAGMAGLSDVCRSFIAGILAHLPALMALTTPSSNSYRRIRPHVWSGAFRCWGPDNREAAVRIPSDPASNCPNNFEIKPVDASANPYLALGGIIAAGLDGVRRRLDLSEPVMVDPGSLSQEERRNRGIDPLPNSLGYAIAQLNENSVLKQALGRELTQAYLAVRAAEWEALKGMEFDDEVKLLLQRY